MDKNTFIGLILIAFVLIGFSYYSSSQQFESATPQTSVEKTKPETVNKATTSQDVVNKQTLQIDSSDIFKVSAVAMNSAPIVLQNEKTIVHISPKGGVISKVELKDYKSYTDFNKGNKATLLLFDDTSSTMNFNFETVDGIYNSSNYTFQTLARTDSTVVLALGATTGDTLYVHYSLVSNTYMVNVEIQTKGKRFKSKEFGLQWHDKVRQQEKGFYFENMYSTLTYKDIDDNTEKLSENTNAQEKPEKQVAWIAFKNQYFSAVLIAGKNAFNVDMLRSDTCGEGSGFIKKYEAALHIPTIDTKGTSFSKFQFYFGPNQYRYLQKMEDYRLSSNDLNLEELVYLGWPIVKWINRFFTIYVFDFLTGFGLNMGVVLLLITLLLRVIVYPTTKKSFLSSAKMRVLKPKVDALNAKYPNQSDAMKKQQEMMQLYSLYGVSPMGGCLPMLIQMPIWIAMFNFVPNAFELRQQSFLWAEDLSTFDSLIEFGMSLPLIGDHLSLFCILFCVTNILYSWLMMKQQQDTMSAEQQQQMKLMQWMMFLMPVVFFFMFNKYSSGLNYYYFISLLTSALTMWYLRRSTDDVKLLEKLEENYKANKNNPNRKLGGLAARMQALQEQQELMKKRQQKSGK